MREMGMIVDDFGKNQCSNIYGDKGTQFISFNDSTIILPKYYQKLIVFITTFPYEHKIVSLQTYDTAMEKWILQMYYNGLSTISVHI